MSIPVKGTPPPASMGNFGKGAMRGRPVVKPKDFRGTLKRLWDLTEGHRKGLNWILLLSALSSASAILSPLVIGRAVTAVDRGDSRRLILFLLAGLYVSDWLVKFLQQYLMASVGQKTIRYIRSSLFTAMEKLPLSFFDKRQHGELMSRLTNDIDNISTTISNSLTQLFTYIFTVLGIFCIMVRLNFVLTGISLSGVVLIMIMTKVITGHTRKLFSEQQKILGRLNGQIEEGISGMTVVKAFCREDEMMQSFEENNEAFRKVSTKALIWSGYLMPITNVINNLSFVAISVLSGMLAAGGAIEIGMISSFLLYIRQFSRPFVEIANIYNNFQTAVAGAERVFEIMDEQPEPEDVPEALPLSSPQGNFELKNVSFGYDDETAVLRDISLTVPAGTKMAVVGPTGAGKTTLINLLTRFYDVTGGEILLDGHDIRDYRMKDLRRSFGVVLQDTSLFAESVRENIRYGRENASEEEIVSAAKTAGADSFIRRLPEGYDTVLSQGGMELSQGERQLLTIARAVLINAPVLILDEATSSVDTVTEQKIRRAMLKITEGRTSFIIAHRLSTIRDSDRIILVDNGRIEEQGTHEELMRKNGQYAAMYRMQTGSEGV
jgi:ATP-binding cassette subfamily B multidrug efflux pump